MTLDQDENHAHTAACFINVQPLALVELFQSRGCKSYAAAMASILEAQSPKLQHLSYDVTFFDELGCKDTFANLRWDEQLESYIRCWD
ncbi:putative DUF1223-domain-containing protein [Seiridium cardinale]|uniref:DUF1223-domain-containing protein n=1 Tax=Seiridium cardinale TaxID=138064 RepID=A0ABR2XAH1_9PEZI